MAGILKHYKKIARLNPKEFIELTTKTTNKKVVMARLDNT
jgi:hypothetical protein